MNTIHVVPSLHAGTGVQKPLMMKIRRLKRHIKGFVPEKPTKNPAFMNRSLVRTLRQNRFAFPQSPLLTQEPQNARPVKRFKSTKSIHPPCQSRVCTGKSIQCSQESRLVAHAAVLTGSDSQKLFHPRELPEKKNRI